MLEFCFLSPCSPFTFRSLPLLLKEMDIDPNPFFPSRGCVVRRRRDAPTNDQLNFDLGPLWSMAASKYGWSACPHLDWSDAFDSLGAVLLGKGEEGLDFEGVLSSFLILDCCPPSSAWPTVVLFRCDGMLSKWEGAKTRLNANLGQPLGLDCNNKKDLPCFELIYGIGRFASSHHLLAQVHRLLKTEGPDGNGGMGGSACSQ
jgi:hypothetical protein